MQKNGSVTSMILSLKLQIMFCWENTQAKLKLNWENIGKMLGILLSEMSGNDGGVFYTRRSNLFGGCDSLADMLPKFGSYFRGSLLMVLVNHV